MYFKKQKYALFFLSTIMLSVFFSSCYYDKSEVLYPGSTCDTSVVTYSSSVAPILSSTCITCHGGATPSAAIRLDNYTSVKQQVDNGRLWGSVSHSGAYSPMPKGGNKLSDCNLSKINIWIKAGAPNN